MPFKSMQNKITKNIFYFSFILELKKKEKILNGTKKVKNLEKKKKERKRRKKKEKIR